MALTYLATSDADSAELKAAMARTEYIAKLARSFAFLAAEGNNEERKALADTDAKVISKWEEHHQAIVRYEKVRAKRETEVLVVETWRSINANRRSGNV
jgi:hypothetical protein